MEPPCGSGSKKDSFGSFEKEQLSPGFFLSAISSHDVRRLMPTESSLFQIQHAFLAHLGYRIYAQNLYVWGTQIR